jgi:hypothetical protein
VDSQAGKKKKKVVFGLRERLPISEGKRMRNEIGKGRRSWENNDAVRVCGWSQDDRAREENRKSWNAS